MACPLYVLLGMRQLRGIAFRFNHGAITTEASLSIPIAISKAKDVNAHYHQHPGCHSWQGVMPPKRVKDQLLSQENPPSGLVVSLLLGDHLLPYICHFFPSQLAHFIVPQALDVLLVIPKHTPEYYNTTTNNSNSSKKKTDTPSITMGALQKCLNLVPQKDREGFVYQDWQNLDGSTLTTWEHRAPAFSASTRIFLAETEIALPTYVQANRSLLDIPIEPKSCKAPLSYIQGTRWYIYEMLHLQILQHYQYWVKVDTDIVFVKSIPISLMHDMTVRGAVFAHTAKYPNRILTPCADTVATAVQTFGLRQMLKSSDNPWNWDGHYCSGDHHSLLTTDSDRYYANFIMGRTDFFQSPGPLKLGTFLSDEWTEGFFRHRWGDQAFWHFALGLFLGPDFEAAVADYTEFRCAPETNCWMSAQEGKRIPDAANLCRNDGAFLHTKDWHRFANQWNRWSSLSKQDLARETKPYRTTYVHDCRNSTRWK
jgi:hypothetical protein